MQIAYTPRQIEVMRWLQHEIEANGYPPSVIELGKRLNVLPTTALRLLQRLEAKGAISRVRGEGRSLKILDWKYITAGKDVLTDRALDALENVYKLFKSIKMDKQPNALVDQVKDVLRNAKRIR